MKILLTLIIFSFLFVSPGIISGAEISPALQQAILAALEDNRPVTAIVFLKDQVDIDHLDQQLNLENASRQVRAYTVITALQEKAALTQRNLLNFLNAKSPLEVTSYQSFWIANFITVKAQPAIVYEISQRNDVDLLDIEQPALKEPAFDEREATSTSTESVEQGLMVINAHKMWAKGYSGAGTLVMNIDTGVDGNHPALSARWRGTHVPVSQAWYGPGSFPSDNDSHGTHTMGTITGHDPVTGDTVGVAPAAEWIAAATIGTGYSWVAAFQWAMDPDGNPLTTDDMPDVISNSFYIGSSSGGGCLSATYATLFNSVEAAGIAVVWSAGNAGPGAQTITGPKNINTNLVNVWATGNINGNDPNLPIRSSSSRGPSGCAGTGSLLIKPEAVAPGTNVRSTVPGGSYGLKTGTSMACPHVAGAVALLKEAFPNTTGHEIKLALYYTAKETPADLAANDPGEVPGLSSGEDHTYGMGVIDVFDAYRYLQGAAAEPSDFMAFSDFSTPTLMLLSWTDPTNLLNGDTLLTGGYHIYIERDSVLIDSVPSGTEQYTDSGLNDGQAYSYSIYAVIDSNGVGGIEAFASWIAGGSPVPQSPLDLSVSGNTAQVQLRWMNPSANIDNTRMDDFAGIYLYQDNVQVASFSRSASDTARLDSASYTPSTAGYFHWSVSAFDNEAPVNESDQSNAVRTPLNLTFMDPFSYAGDPDSIYWHNEKTIIDDRGVDVPSPPYSLNLNGTGIPVGGDMIESYPIDLSVSGGSGIKFSYLYQAEGTGDPPLTTDSLLVWFRNDLGDWIRIRSYGGEGVFPYRQVNIDMDSLSASSNNYFHSQFQVRMNTTGRISPILPRSDWFVDNIYLGIPRSVIVSSADTVEFDTTLVNGSTDYELYVSNVGLQDLTVLDITSDNGVFSVDTTAFPVAYSGNQTVRLGYSPSQAGVDNGILRIVSDAFNADTLAVYLRGISVTATGIGPEVSNLPREYYLAQNYPNPFNPTTMIHYELPRGSGVSLAIYNLLGQRVKTLVEGWKPAGRYDIAWQGDNDLGARVSSGVYIYRIDAGEYRRSLKMLLMK